MSRTVKKSAGKAAARGARARSARPAGEKTAISVVSARAEKRNGKSRAGDINGAAHAELELNGARQNGSQVCGGKTSAAKVNGSKVNGSRVNGSTHPSGRGVPIDGPHSEAEVGKVRRAAKSAVRVQASAGRRVHGARNLVMQDRVLVDRCLNGEAAAWSQMYARFHGSLLASIRAFLGRAGHDIHLVDEISARVWYSLVRNEFELLAKFDPARGCRLSTFLSVLGKSEARLLLRSERRRKTRECVASRPEVELVDATCGGALSDDEFLATLSPREKAFYFDILVAAREVADESEYSRQNQWQLRHRVRKKLEQFLE